METNSVQHVIHDVDLLNILAKQGITQLHSIQIQAIQAGLFQHRNFLICTPSGSGKTLIAEMAVYYTLLQELGKALYLVPYKALATEKYTEFTATLTPYGFSVGIATSDDEEDPPLNTLDLLITTFEKGDAILRDWNFHFPFQCIVADEIHEITTPTRGARLETLLINLITNNPATQLIALSATIQNYTVFNEWLSSLDPTRPFILIQSDQRPVPLDYKLEMVQDVVEVIRVHIRRIIQDNGSVLVFVPRRKDCLTFAEDLSKVIALFLTNRDRFNLHQIAHAISAKKLQELILSGVAYHNASLSNEIRKLLEKGFRDRYIKVLIATTTLAAGVNTPARCVIVSNIIQSREYGNLDESIYLEKSIVHLGRQYVHPIPPNLLFQMLGRAGRFGYDTKGEGIVFVRNPTEMEYAQRAYFQPLISTTAPLLPRYSNLESQLFKSEALQEYILLLLSQNATRSTKDIRINLNKSFLLHNLRHSLQESKCDPLDFFGIQPPTLESLLVLYSDQILQQYTLKLQSISTMEIRGQVLFSPDGKANSFQTYLCWMSPQRLFCACQPDRHWLRFYDNVFIYEKICPHLAAFLHGLATHQNTQIWTLAQTMVHTLLPRESVLDYLQRNKLIGSDGIDGMSDIKLYHITTTGKLLLSLYLYPAQFLEMKAIIEHYDLSDDRFVLQKVAQIYSSSTTHTFDQVFHIVDLWMNESPLEEILAIYPKMGAADIMNLKKQMSRLIANFEAIATYSTKEQLAQRLSTLRIRIDQGIKEELIDLMERLHRPISRNKARILYDVGYTNYDILLTTPIMDIFKKTGISIRTLAEMIQNTTPIPPSLPATMDSYLEKSQS